MVRARTATIWSALGVAVLVAVAGAAVLAHRPSLPTLSALCAICIVAWIVVRDIKDFIIPDAAVAGLSLLSIAANLVEAGNTWSLELPLLVLGAVVCGGALWLVREVFYRLRGFDGVGFGDVKLGAACGAWIGIEGFAWAVFLASGFGLCVVALLSAIRPGLPVDRLPFGALLAPACWLIWVFGLPVLR